MQIYVFDKQQTWHGNKTHLGNKTPLATSTNFILTVNYGLNNQEFSLIIQLKIYLVQTQNKWAQLAGNSH